jgi:hypothetical protein
MTEIETEQPPPITYVSLPCETCDGRGCDWCCGEPNVLRVRGGRYVCEWHTTMPDMDGSMMEIGCDAIATIMAKSLYAMSHEMGIGRTYACHLHGPDMIRNVVVNCGKFVEVGCEQNGFVSNGEPYEPGTPMLGCPECGIQEGMSQSQAWSERDDRLPQREVVRTRTVNPTDPTAVYDLSCGHTTM